MKNVIKFLLFITYSTSIFFLPNSMIILFFILLNILMMIIAKVNIKKVISKTLIILPFIIFTFLINWLLDNLNNALWIGIKLFVVCNITIIYSETTSIARSSRNNKSALHTT